MSATIGGLLARLRPLGEIADRPRLGGWELLAGGRAFALFQGGRLWLRTTPETRGDYLRRGSLPFTPNPAMELGDFYEVPDEIMSDDEALVSWARRSF